MRGVILQEWEFSAKSDGASIVIPDGCRDLIYMAKCGRRPCWMVTDLDDTTYSTTSWAGDYMKGFRLRPGAIIDVDALLHSVRDIDAYGDISDRIGNFTALSRNMSDALACIGGVRSTQKAAQDLGVNARNLQRLLKPTGRTAVAWLSLGRARRAARMATASDLSDTAFATGYADQAHMSREFRRWFGTTPKKIGGSIVASQLEHAGYF